MTPSLMLARFSIGAVALASALHAQPARSITIGAEPPACQGCRIVLSPLASFGDPADFPSVFRVGALALSRAGDLYAPSLDEWSVLRYNAKSRQAATVGVHGAGPGEFRSISRVRIGPGDSVWIYDSSLRRVSVFAPGGTRYVRLSVLKR